MLSIISLKVVGSNSLGQFVLTGISAGAFGAAFNCDKVWFVWFWNILEYLKV